jgi:hypothetical protein
MWLEMGSCGDKLNRANIQHRDQLGDRFVSIRRARFKMFSDNKTNLARRGEKLFLDRSLKASSVIKSITKRGGAGACGNYRQPLSRN